MKISIAGVLSLLSLSLLGMAGCAGKHPTRTATFGSREDMLSYGVYTSAALDSGLSTKLSLNQGNSYSKKKFKGSCLIQEYKGEWNADNQSIEFHLTEIRRRPDCNTEDWQTDKVDKTNKRLLRSVTMSSFELLDQEDQTSDQWIKFVKR